MFGMVSILSRSWYILESYIVLQYLSLQTIQFRHQKIQTFIIFKYILDINFPHRNKINKCIVFRERILKQLNNFIWTSRKQVKFCFFLLVRIKMYNFLVVWLLLKKRSLLRNIEMACILDMSVKVHNMY